jgi:hypothetical protein
VQAMGSESDPWWRRLRPELTKVRYLIEMKLFQAELFRTSLEPRQTDGTSLRSSNAEDELERIRREKSNWRRHLSAAHQCNHELNQLIPVIATDEYLYSTLEYELKKTANPEHGVLITELFDEGNLKALLSRHGVGTTAPATTAEPAGQDRRRAKEVLRRLYEERDEQWVYERAVLRLKRYYLMFHALVIGIILAVIGISIGEIRGNTGSSLELLLAMLVGALGATLAATFKLRDTVARLNDLPAIVALVGGQAVIGATLGFVAWLLLRSGIIQVGGDATLDWETLSLVAFASGFSEPLVIGVISRLTGSSDDSLGQIAQSDGGTGRHTPPQGPPSSWWT